MLFTKTYTFTTTFKPEEIIQKLKAAQYPSDKRVWYFMGKIDKQSFSITPIFHSDDRRRAKPEFVGSIVPEKNGSIINLKIGYPLAVKVFLYASTFITTPVVLFYFWQSNNPNFKLYSIGLFAANMFMYFMVGMEYYVTKNRALEILSKKLLLKDTL